jgi:epoxyqueuosine reductase
MGSVKSSPTGTTKAILREARRIGFDKAGVAPVRRPREADRLLEWIAAGRHATMTYMARDPESRVDAARSHPWARSMICVAKSYPFRRRRTRSMQGRVSSYAWGPDYHDVLGEALKKLATFMKDLAGARTRIAVDHSALFERAYGRAAGLGWIGKNTMLIGKDLGSFFFQGEIVTDLSLSASRPYVRDHCGTCTRCIDRCPTGAIVAPHVLDARRCISYLTIEHRGVIDPDLRPLMGDWIFGCDVCQEACPWNRRRAGRAGEAPPDLGSFMGMSEEEFRARFRRRPIWRAHRDGLLRNVAIALGNTGSAAAVAPLTRGLADPSALVRRHSAWALERIGTPAARRALRRRAAVERDPGVLEELRSL